MEQTFKGAWVQARYFRLSSSPSSLACLLTVSAATQLCGNSVFASHQGWGSYYGCFRCAGALAYEDGALLVPDNFLWGLTLSCGVHSQGQCDLQGWLLWDARYPFGPTHRLHRTLTPQIWTLSTACRAPAERAHASRSALWLGLRRRGQGVVLPSHGGHRRPQVDALPPHAPLPCFLLAGRVPLGCSCLPRACVTRQSGGQPSQSV